MSPLATQPLQGRVALVTGASTGIGRAVAVGLGSAGTSVIVNHPHTPELALQVVGAQRSGGIDATE